MPPSEISPASIRLRPFARRHHGAAATAALCLAATFWSAGPALAAANDAQARTIFEKFIAAQNAHNSDDVKALLWHSSATLLFARGIETRGRDAVADRFKTYYEGTWHLEPDMSQFHATVISDDVMQILVPIVFTRGLPGKPSQDNKFLISQTFVHDAKGWHVASIMPIANTQLK